MMNNPQADPESRFYRIRTPGGFGWARIWITSDGSFSTMSDFGNYGHWWSPYVGQDFRKQLTHFNDHYLIDKLTYGMPYKVNAEKTKKQICEHICSRRRYHGLPRDDARREFDLAQATDFDDAVSQVDWYRETELQDASELFVHEKDDVDRVGAFVKEVWPAFMSAIEDEFDHEREDYILMLDAAGIDTTTPEICALLNL